MDHSSPSLTTPEIEVTVNEAGKVVDAEPAIDVAVALDEVAYLRGWVEAMAAARAAMRSSGTNKPDEYFEGWMDAVTVQPADPTRLSMPRSRYARGYVAGAREHDLAHRGGYDAE